MKVRCNNCDWEGFDEDLSLYGTKGDGKETLVCEETSYGRTTVYDKEYKGELFFFKGCPNCKTDDYLMDLIEENGI